MQQGLFTIRLNKMNELAWVSVLVSKGIFVISSPKEKLKKGTQPQLTTWSHGNGNSRYFTERECF